MGIRIRCKVLRAGGSTVDVPPNGRVSSYRFLPEHDAPDAHVCEVDDEAHAQMLLADRAHYELAAGQEPPAWYEGEEPAPAVGPAPEPPPARTPDAWTNVELQKWAAANGFNFRNKAEIASAAAARKVKLDDRKPPIEMVRDFAAAVSAAA